MEEKTRFELFSKKKIKNNDENLNIIEYDAFLNFGHRWETGKVSAKGLIILQSYQWFVFVVV